MKMTPTTGIALAAGLLLAAGLIWHFKRDPAAQVIRRFEALAELIAKTEPENPLQMAFRGQELQDFFTDPATLNTPIYGLSGPLRPTDIASQTVSARTFFTQLALRFQDFNVTFPVPDRADVSVTARIEGQTTTAETVEEIRELRCVLQRTDGTWRFAACELVDVLQK